MRDGLLPRPQELTAASGTISWTSPIRLRVPVEWCSVAETFAADLARAVGWMVDINGDGPWDIELRHVEDCVDEGYRLAVDQTAILEAGDRAGAAYALTTLRQLGPAQLWSSTRSPLDSFEVPRVRIEDAPRFAWRGVHLDVARHFFDVATVRRLIDLLGAHRLNRLHLHLNDDQGWRVEVPGWPRLSEVGSRRRSSPLGHDDDGLDDDVAHAGCYSVTDLAALRDHACARGVTIVPEIDLPGHAQAVLAAYPQLANSPEPLEVWTRWGISPHVMNVSPAALDFTEEVVRFVAGLFPSSPVHIGGDECPTHEWESSHAAKRVMEEHGFVDARQLQGLFSARLAAALHADGHPVVAWDEVLDAEVPEDTVVMAWRSPSKGEEAARRGLDVVMAPMQFLYFDWLNSAAPDEPVAQAPAPYVTTWEKVYRYSVIPLHLEPEFHRRVLGAQAQLWSEYIATRDHLDYMAFPRLCAFSEVAWGTATTLDDFRPRLEIHLERLAAMGVAYRPLDPA